jgi:hypothetical protein
MTTQDKLARIIQAATYLGHYARGQEEQQSAATIRRLAQEMINDLGKESA